MRLWRQPRATTLPSLAEIKRERRDRELRMTGTAPRCDAGVRLPWAPVDPPESHPESVLIEPNDAAAIERAQAEYTGRRRVALSWPDVAVRVCLDVQDLRPPIPFAISLEHQVATLCLPLLGEPGETTRPTLDELVATAPERARRALGDSITPGAEFLWLEVRSSQECAWALDTEQTR